ncbi:ras family small GTPase [Naegleria gruberi]|uniref:Ras family small GTPase n=1 Tax=Naegleria gruberi TaxID=5762 RepID=D2UXD7_NAEGR|nr:ras family small GTPase [Naegleria gruberi]EFC50267.1 ras family small GTPase [Naegleria gruberi]|eukprot:XP_002683011.1 ras family small GTPase [Naegleria gruberi strain NEG-M]
MVEKHTIGIFGPYAVGKTSVSVQFVENKYTETHDPTIEDYFEITKNIRGITSNITILDTAGQESYQSLLSDAMSEAEGFILVYSVVDRESFEKVQKLREKVTMVQSATVPVILVGNKADLEDERQVSTSEAEQLAHGVGCPFIEASAKTGLNIEKIFELIVCQVRKSKGLKISLDGNNDDLPNIISQTTTNDNSLHVSNEPSTPTSPNQKKTRKNSNSKDTNLNSPNNKRKDCDIQ